MGGSPKASVLEALFLDLRRRSWARCFPTKEMEFLSVPLVEPATPFRVPAKNARFSWKYQQKPRYSDDYSWHGFSNANPRAIPFSMETLCEEDAGLPWSR